MNRITSAETALLMPAVARNPRTERIEAIMAEARHAQSTALAARINGFFQTLAGAVTAIRNRRETIAQLRGLSDRELTDIGLSRAGIVAAAVAAAPAGANDQAGTQRAA